MKNWFQNFYPKYWYSETLELSSSMETNRIQSNI